MAKQDRLKSTHTKSTDTDPREDGLRLLARIIARRFLQRGPGLGAIDGKLSHDVNDRNAATPP